MTHKTHVLSDEQIEALIACLGDDAATLREESPEIADNMDAAAEALRSLATLAALGGQEPIGYFRSMPFGWEDCAKSDDGAMPLFALPPAQPAPAPVDEREAFIQWLSETYPVAYDRDKAEHYWECEHISALVWKHCRAALQAPEPQTKGGEA